MAFLKLSKRLKQIDKMVSSNYDHIWDCCCDHGFLGAALLSRQAAPKVHFVDIVPKLMSELENKLKRFYASSSWETHCLDVATLPLTQYQGRHLIIIAGVGGDLMTTFINAIIKKYPQITFDFLLCPVHHQFALRKKLIELELHLQDEVLIEDNGRFYEIILTSSSSHLKIPPVGSKIWQSNSTTQTQTIARYLDKTLNHYRRIEQGKSNKVQHIIDAYAEVSLYKHKICS